MHGFARSLDVLPILLLTGCVDLGKGAAPSTLVGSWDCLGEGYAGDMYFDEVGAHPEVTETTYYEAGSCEETLEATGNPEEALFVAPQGCTYGPLEMTITVALTLMGDGTASLEQAFEGQVDGEYVLGCVPG